MRSLKSLYCFIFVDNLSPFFNLIVFKITFSLCLISSVSLQNIMRCGFQKFILCSPKYTCLIWEPTFFFTSGKSSALMSLKVASSQRPYSLLLELPLDMCLSQSLFFFLTVLSYFYFFISLSCVLSDYNSTSSKVFILSLILSSSIYSFYWKKF